MQKINKKACLIHALIALLSGALLYIVLSPNTLISRAVYAALRIQPAVFKSKNEAGCLVNLLRCCGADICWAYALTFTVSLVLVENKKQIPLAAAMSILFEILIECAELIPVFHLTFDWWDILAEITASLTAALIIYIMIKRGK